MSDKEYSVEERIEIIKNQLNSLKMDIAAIQSSCAVITLEVIALEEEVKKK